jgi:23S rRNA (uracil1939-C5)-methyltransferase
VQKKKPIVLERIRIDDYAAEGKSVARLEGKVIFVEGAVPGDVADVRLSKNKKDWAEGSVVQFHSYAPDRVQPFCQHFGVCGGCQWQMLPYEKQLHYKQQQVHDVLKRIGKIPLPELQPIAGAANDRFYRNKLEYTFSTKEFTPAKPAATGDALQDGFTGAAGFHAKGFFDKVVQIEKCWLQAEPTNAIRNFIRAYAAENGLSFYDIRRHTGLLRTMQVRLCRTGQTMVNIVLGEENEPARSKLFQNLMARFPEVTTWLYTINLKWNDAMHDLEPVVVSGNGYVVETLEDFSFKIGPKSFFQTNTEQAETLYRITRDFAELNGQQVVYDLYCGTGSIGIFCSRGAKKIIGVEAIEAAVQDARINAALNQINEAVFVTGDVTDVCNAAFFEQHGRPDVIITDPPRAGMHEKLVHKILEIEAPLVVYVSCNPATQARDLAWLDAKYAVTRVQPVDMFPHTHHIENVVQLKLKA